MSIKKDLSGLRFGGWLVLYDTGKRKPTKFMCRCDCGEEKEVRSGDLVFGSSNCCKKCGNKKHGMTKQRIHVCWSDMRQRCNNTKNKHYERYGGRGIKICDEWDNDFMSFYNWSIENGYDEKLTIDRIDNDKGYYPENCRWADRSTQNRNKDHKKYNINGVEKTFPQWCEFTGLKYNKVYQRIHTLGHSYEKAFELEERKESKK